MRHHQGHSLGVTVPWTTVKSRTLGSSLLCGQVTALCIFRTPSCKNLSEFPPLPNSTEPISTLCQDCDPLGCSPKGQKAEGMGARTAGSPCSPIQDAGREEGGVRTMHLGCSGHHCGHGQGAQRRTVTLPSGLFLKYESKYVNTLQSVRLNHNSGRVVCHC